MQEDTGGGKAVLKPVKINPMFMWGTEGFHILWSV